MSSYPYWSTPANLGTFPNGYSFSSNPISIVFGDTAELPCTVTFLNGSLPNGVRWQQNNFTVDILGIIEDIISNTDFQFTLRLSNGTLISDQTFYISVTNAIDVLSWSTNTQTVLGYYYQNDTATFSVHADNNPVKKIIYTLDTTNVCKGINVDPNNGEILFDINWQSDSSYTAFQDFVYNNGVLYQCVVGGTSSSTNGPSGSGTFYDSSYPKWLANTYYYSNAIVTNDNGKIYICTNSGTSGVSGGPTGTGSQINDGIVLTWEYIGQVVVWQSFTYNTYATISLPITATTNTQSISNSFTIWLLGTPYKPLFVDPPNTIINTVPNSEFQYLVPVVDPNYTTLTYTQSGLPSWISINPISGQLYGYVPASSVTQQYTFTITASDQYYTDTINYILQVNVTTPHLTWITQSDLGVVLDGTYADIQLVATTTNIQNPITYTFTGGMLPPQTVIISDTGNISGIIETHLVPKTYIFEVTATDGITTSIQQFSLQIQPQNLGKYANASIPIMGDTRVNWVLDSGNLIDYSNLYHPQNPYYGLNKFPEIPLVTGFAYTNIEDIRNTISWWLHNWQIEYGNVYIGQDPKTPYNTIWLSVHDSNKVQQWSPNTSYQQGDWVSNYAGQVYICLVTGVTGNFPGPIGTSSQIIDGSTQWEYASVPNELSNWSYDLPWYPERLYKQGECVVSNGIRLQSQSSGYSGGSFGPTLQQDATYYDGALVWKSVATNQSATTEYPPSIYNVRQAIINTFGFANERGINATAVPIVDPTTTGISSIQVTNSGSGFWAAPVVNIVGKGTGASAISYLELLTASIQSSTGGFAVGQTFFVQQGIGTYGIIEITAVDSYGYVQSINIVDGGSYSQFPDTPIAFTNPIFAQLQFTVEFSLSIKNIVVVDIGTGYDSTTTVNFGGSEILPLWQQNSMGGYVTCIPLAYVTTSTTSLLQNENLFSGESLSVNAVKIVTQGAEWEGNTSWDGLDMFDVESTRFVEVDTNSQTIFDNNVTDFDTSTTFDQLPDVAGNISQSLILLNNDSTMEDYMTVLMSDRSNQRYSYYSQQYLFFFGTPFTN